MTVSGVPRAPSYLAGSPPAEREAGPVEVLLLKKAQEQMKQQGEALVRMLEAAGPAAGPGPRLDVYA